MPAELAKVKELFLAVLEMTAAERAGYLDTACAGDTALREQIEKMLLSNANSGELLPRTPGELLADTEKTESDQTAAFAPQANGSATFVDREKNAESLAFLAASDKPGNLGRLGHYEVQEVIGKGGFGVVLRAFDEKLHRAVAIKVLSPAYAAIGSARARFIREARTAAAIKNEHVVAIHAVADEAQPPYLVMEIIEGISLQDKLDKTGPLPLKEILRIGLQIAEGLAAAHKHGFMHRDIKPANILLENGVERVKITDFGLARAVDDASVTQSGTVAGTPMYMSPEQAEGLTVDHRSDLFSLGTVLYAMCTGHPPFRASGTHAVLKRVMEASPRPIREVNNEIPDWLADIIAKLHAKKPEDRYQTAKEVAELLGQHLADVQAGRSIERASHVSGGSESLSPPANAGGSPPASPQPGWIGPVCLGLLLTAGFAGATAQVLNSAAQRWPHVAPLLLFGVGGVAFLGVAIPVALGVEWVVRIRRGALTRSKAFAFGFVGTQLVAGGIGFLLNYKPPIERDPYTPTFGGPGWRKLYDGKSLAGWKAFGDARGSDGEIVLPGDLPGSAVESIDRLPRNFHLLMRVKVERGGLTVRLHNKPRGEKLDNQVPEDGWFLDLSGLEKEGEGAATLRLLDGGRQETKHVGPIAKPGDWFYLEIIAKDDATEVLINGKSLNELLELRTGKHGKIASVPANALLTLSQVGKKGAQAAIRNIEIKDLTPPVDAAALVKAEREKFQGVWQLVSLERHGETLPEIPPALKGFRMQFQANQNMSYFGNGPAIHGIYTIDPSQTPATLDVIGGGKEEPSIYRWDGEKLVICTRPKQRPKDFTTRVGDPCQIMTFVRVGSNEKTKGEPGWVQLFNGKDLTGWSQVLGAGKWTVANGVLTGTANRNVAQLSSVRPVGGGPNDYANFHLRAQVRLKGSGSGMILFRQLKDRYSLDIEEKGTGSIALLKNGHKWLQLNEHALVEPGVWFNLELIADGPKLISKVNGRVVANVNDSTLGRGGLDLLLSASPGPVILEFKKIEIKELPPPEPSWVPLFNGKDWTGWKSSDTPWAIHGTGEIIADRRGYAQTVPPVSANFFLRLETKLIRGQTDIGFNINGKTGWRLNFAESSEKKGMADISLWANVAGKSLTQTSPARNIAKLDEWMKIEIRTQGKRAQVSIKGTNVLELTNDDFLPSPGLIGLTVAPSGLGAKEGAALFRNIEIKELPPEEPGWVSLFNGKDLTGWKNHPDQPGDWKVENKMLVGRGRMALLYSERGDYGDYDLRIEAKVSKGGYGGVYIRTPEFPPIRKQVFEDPKGHRVVLSADSKHEPAFNTGSLKTWRPKEYMVQACTTPISPDEWFTLDILTRGPEVFVRVNGKQTAQIGKTAEQAHNVGLKGFLVLEAAGDDTVIHIRKIEIKEVPPAKR